MNRVHHLPPHRVLGIRERRCGRFDRYAARNETLRRPDGLPSLQLALQERGHDLSERLALRGAELEIVLGPPEHEAVETVGRPEEYLEPARPLCLQIGSRLVAR